MNTHAVSTPTDQRTPLVQAKVNQLVAEKLVQDRPLLTFQHDNMKSSVDDPNADWQLLLRIECDFRICLSDEIFYEEVHFTVVELLASYHRWKRQEAGDLIFNTMESGDEPFVAFFDEGAGEYRPFAFHQNFEARSTISRAALISAFDALSAEVVRETRGRFSVRIESLWSD